MDTNTMREQFEAAFIAQQVAAFGEYTRQGAVHRLKRDGEFDKPPTDYDLHRREQGMYDEYWIEMLWWAWQASREAVVVELPQVVAYEAGYDSIRDNEYAGLPDRLPDFDYDELFKLHRSDEVREAIEAQGLRVTP